MFATKSARMLGLSVLLCVTLSLFGELTHRSVLLYICKPLATILILTVPLIQWRNQHSPYALFISIGLFFSLLGDVALLFPERFFLYGLVFFLFAHISYLIAFSGQHGILRAPRPSGFRISRSPPHSSRSSTQTSPPNCESLSPSTPLLSPRWPHRPWAASSSSKLIPPATPPSARFSSYSPTHSFPSTTSTEPSFLPPLLSSSLTTSPNGSSPSPPILCFHQHKTITKHQRRHPKPARPPGEVFHWR